jgi:hypothetical protein
MNPTTVPPTPPRPLIAKCPSCGELPELTLYPNGSVKSATPLQRCAESHAAQPQRFEVGKVSPPKHYPAAKMRVSQE